MRVLTEERQRRGGDEAAVPQRRLIATFLLTPRRNLIVLLTRLRHVELVGAVTKRAAVYALVVDVSLVKRHVVARCKCYHCAVRSKMSSLFVKVFAVDTII